MGLNKPITGGSGLTAADVQTTVQSIIDAQTNTLKTDIPSSISGGASVDDIKSALDEKLPQYSIGAVVKSRQIVEMSAISADALWTMAKEHPLCAYSESGNGKYVIDVTTLDENNNDVSVNRIEQLLKDTVGCVVLAPVDKSKSLIHTELNTFYDNRDFDNGTLQRAISYKKGGTRSGRTWFYVSGISAEKVSVLEFY